MSSRGKKIVSLVFNNSEKTECSSSTESDEEPPGHNISVVVEMHETTKRNLPRRVNQLTDPSHRTVSCDEYANDTIDLEMESLFGDISDTDDPTYQPSPRQPISEDDLITLQELLGDDLQPNNCDSNIILENDIEMLREENRQQNEAIENTKFILEEVLNKMWKKVKPLKRWRKPDTKSWAVNVAKKRRSDGLPYKCHNKDRPAKGPQPVDCQHCKFKCCNIEENAREKICRHYWNLDFVGRKNFILSNVCVESPKRVLAVRNKRKQRSFTKKCYLTSNNVKIQVCQKFFTKTLNIGPSVIIDAIQKRNIIGNFDSNDKRGKHEPHNKSEPEVLKGIREHIESFPCMDAHYTRKDTNRKFLGPDLNIRKMYLLYQELCKERNQKTASEITYRRIFSTEYNMSFFVPKKDQCLICTNYENADSEKKKLLEKQYREHIERKKICNAEKQKDKERANKDPNFCSISFDLQAVLQIPHCKINLLYYSRKLCVFNLTIYEAGLPNNAYCFLWSEINGKKGSCEIGTILLHYLSKCVPSNVTEVSLFSDTCSGQNRNQYVAALLLWAVHNIENLQIIEQKFLESGHTYMEADSMHSAIESQKKETSVYSMQDWISICQRARRKRVHVIDKKKITKKPYTTKEFKFHEFYDLKDLASKVIHNKDKDNDGNKVQWLKVKRMRFVKGERRIYFNYDMSEDFKYIDVSGTEKNKTRGTRSKRQKKYCDEWPTELKKNYEDSLPISQAKKNDLLNLIKKNVIPEELEPWYTNLKTGNETADVEEEAFSLNES